MYLHSVRIDSIRGFRGGSKATEITFCRPGNKYAGWTVLAGRNGAGKSTLLRAIALSIAGPVAARALCQSFSGWINHGCKSGFVATQLSFEATSDRFSKTGRLPATTFWTGLRWTSTSGTEPKMEEYDELNKTMKQTPSRGPWSDEPKGWFLSGYGPFRRLTGHAADAQRLMVGPNHVPRLVSLFREDASLLESVQWLKDMHLRRLEERAGAEELLRSTLAILNCGLLPDGVSVEKVDSEGLWVTRGASTLHLSDLSDGYRVTIALIVDILQHLHKVYGSIDVRTSVDNITTCNNAGVVLIDEVDVHLHVSWQQRIGFWLKRTFPNIQFIVSSHSPFVCQAADPAGLIRLPAPGEDLVATIVEPELQRRIIHGTVDEVSLSELFGMDSTRSPDTVAMLNQLAHLEAQRRATPLSPTDESRLEQLQLELKPSPSQEIIKALQALTLDS